MFGTSLPLIQRVLEHDDQIAIIDGRGRHSYADLLANARKIASYLLDGEPDLQQARIPFMVASGFEYVATQWGIWLAGGVAVPICLSYPSPEIEYLLADSEPKIIISDAEFAKTLRPLAEAGNIRFVLVSAALKMDARPLPDVTVERRAMMLYTSGTTGKPKGVVISHTNLQAQIETLIIAWAWKPDDHILHALPLHHTHGIVNALLCALWAGARCEMLPKFDAERVWRRFLEGGITLFMAVPTIYVRLIAAWEAASSDEQKQMSRACKRLRLMISGSAALPASVFEQWREISGHALLERYGMTEIGMALANPLDGDRRPGFVGTPLPGVEVRLVSDRGRRIRRPGRSGEIEVRGANVFTEYWRKPDATRDSFHRGWFRTGDVATVENGYYRILGRESVDIIKTGGYKVSALDIEEVLRTHPIIKECAVVGVDDEEWGERVCVAIVVEQAESLDLDQLRGWAKARLAPYKIPTRMKTVDDLPRNAMGKVTKPEVKNLFKPS